MSSMLTEIPKVGKRDLEIVLNKKLETDQGGRGGTYSRGSDEEDNVRGRKKLKLSREQSGFLEASFKEHHTLNPVSNKISIKKLVT